MSRARPGNAPPGSSPATGGPPARWMAGGEQGGEALAGGGRRVAPGAGHEAARDRRLARRAAWRERPRKICSQKDTPTADGARTRRGPAGYFAAFFLRSAQEAVIRSETAFFWLSSNGCG